MSHLSSEFRNTVVKLERLMTEYETAVKALRQIAGWTAKGGKYPQNSTTDVVNGIARRVLDRLEIDA